MAIVKTVSFYDFERYFKEYGRGNNFSYDGLKILFDYLENLSEDIGEHIELDVIGLCCDYTEMTIKEVIRDVLLGEYELNDDGDDVVDDVIEALSDQTIVLGYEWTGGEYIIVFQSF